MRRRVAMLGAAVALLASGCGGDPGDLMSLQVSGGPTAEKHTLVVSGDGRGSCDRGKLVLLPGDRVIDAREIVKEANDLLTKAASYPARPGARRYALNTGDGTVRWSEGTPALPSVLPKAQLLALQLERLLCR